MTLICRCLTASVTLSALRVLIALLSAAEHTQLKLCGLGLLHGLFLNDSRLSCILSTCVLHQPQQCQVKSSVFPECCIFLAL